MEKKQKIVVSIVVILAIAVIFLFITRAISTHTGYVVKDTNIESLAKCLSENNVKMYGAFWCGHCQNQKSLFEGNLESMNIYVECDPRGDNSQTDLCLDKGIRVYPTWEINGQLYTGEKSFSQLAELSQCLI